MQATNSWLDPVETPWLRLFHNIHFWHVIPINRCSSVNVDKFKDPSNGREIGRFSSTYKREAAGSLSRARNIAWGKNGLNFSGADWRKWVLYPIGTPQNECQTARASRSTDSQFSAVLQGGWAMHRSGTRQGAEWYLNGADWMKSKVTIFGNRHHWDLGFESCNSGFLSHIILNWTEGLKRIL